MKREAKSQTKILENHHLTVIKTATIENCKCWQECAETGTLVHCWCECKMVQYSWSALSVDIASTDTEDQLYEYPKSKSA